MIFASYAVWHYGGALRSGVTLLQNIIAFFYHFFSVPLLLKTYFSKFGRLGEKYKKGLDIENLLSVFLVNTLMRVVGALIRSIFILLGLVAITVSAVVGIVLLLAWLIFPLIVVVSFVYGLSLLI